MSTNNNNNTTSVMVPVGKINQSMKLLLLECKRLTTALPDVSKRDDDLVALGATELARLTKEFTTLLEETNKTDERIFSGSFIENKYCFFFKNNNF